MSTEKTDLARFNNSWYKPGASFLKRGLWYCMNNAFFCSRFPFSEFKIFLLKLFGARVGKKVVIKPGVNIKAPWFLSIGDFVWIGENVWIDNLVKVSIASNVCLSQGAMLLTGNHNYKKSTFDLMTGEIVLEEGVWIGAKAVVCPGVICASHSLLAVGSIATSNLEAYGIYQGNPAVKMREREIN
ncbi:MAG: WcaF family extracellular polysaccharide biosynthesis acetyltransferase [Bacteroidetes bacterium]|nr:WcaF family extracellular polysaccharide biosynthesis acetyltransferase [Bacteroidota bacterium]